MTITSLGIINGQCFFDFAALREQCSSGCLHPSQPILVIYIEIRPTESLQLQTMRRMQVLMETSLISLLPEYVPSDFNSHISAVR